MTSRAIAIATLVAGCRTDLGTNAIDAASNIDLSVRDTGAGLLDLAVPLDSAGDLLDAAAPLRLQLSYKGPVSDARVFQLAVFDYDLDGHLDLVTPNANILLGNGDGSFQPAVTATQIAGYGVIAADWNNDGRLDLAVAERAANSVAFFVLNGPSRLGSPSRIQGDGAPAGLVAADFNLDGRMDVATANSSLHVAGNTVTLLFGQGDGTFRYGMIRSLDTKGANPQELVAGDLDGDGLIDLVVADSDADNIVALFNTQKGWSDAFGSVSVVAPMSHGVLHLALTGLGGAPNAPRTTVIVPNGGQSGGTARSDLIAFKAKSIFTSSAVGAAARAIAGVQCADFDGDRRDDCAVGMGMAGLGWLHAGMGNTIEGPDIVASGCTLTGGLAIADFNGDGKPDIAAGGDKEVCVFLNRF